MNENYKYIGRTTPIHDAGQKVRGEVVYAGDMQLPGMLYAKLLLSPIPHGILKNIDTSLAEKLPGVVKIFTHFNTPQVPFTNYRLFLEQEGCPEDELLFPEKVRFVGDRVAAVVAVSLAIAKRAADLIAVEYEVLSASAMPVDALNEDALKIHDCGNLLGEYRFAVDDAQPVFADDDQLVETEISTQQTHHAALETHVCVADCNSSGKVTIWTPCQGVYGVRTVVADMLGLPYNQVRVIKTPMGGSFGGKQSPILEPVAAFLAKEIRRPVKLQFNRQECISSTIVRPAVCSKMKTRVSKAGQLLSVDIDAVLNAGAYVTSSLDYIESMGTKLSKLYRIDQNRQYAKAVYTNTPVAGGARGWGSPEFFTAWEIHMDQIAKAIRIDPVELRLKNLVHPFDLDKRTKKSLGNARAIDCLERGAAAFNWAARFADQKQSGRFRRGIGMACGAHKNGLYGGWPEYSTMTLKMNEDGSFNLTTCVHDMGCGTITSMKMIVAEIVDVSPELISVVEADTEISPYDFGTYGSRVTYVCGACAYQAGEKIKSKILAAAAQLLETQIDDLSSDDGVVWVTEASERRLTYQQIATRARNQLCTDIITTQTYKGTANPGVYGAHFAEVEVDTETGLARVIDYLAVHDVGRALNPGMVEGADPGRGADGHWLRFVRGYQNRPDQPDPE